MKRREFYQRLQDIDPEDRRAMEQLAELFEEDYVTAGEDLTDPAVAEDIRARAQADMEYFMAKYDALLEKINLELRRAGATDAQINWGSSATWSCRPCRTCCATSGRGSSSASATGSSTAWPN